MINRVELIGNIGKNPAEVRYSPQGLAVANLSMATNSFSGSGETARRYTEWHRLVAFGNVAELIGNPELYAPGKQIYVEGRLQTRSWTDAKDKIKRYVTEIVVQQCRLLGAAPATAGAGGMDVPLDAYDDVPGEAPEAATPAKAKAAPAATADGKDKIPF